MGDLVLAGLGMAAQQIHTERFGARTAINPGVVEAPPVTPHQPAGPPGNRPLGSRSPAAV